MKIHFKHIGVIINIVIGIIFLFNYDTCNAQKRVEGKYYIEGMGYLANSITFFKDGTFEDISSGCVSAYEYGKGHYTLTKDSLILNYDLTEVLIKGYHILKPYSNKKDTIELKVKVFDFNKNPLSGVEIDLLSKEIPSKMTNERGELFYKLPLKEEDGNIILTLLNNSSYFFSYNRRWSYEMEVYLSKVPDHFIATAIKGTVIKYKVYKWHKDYFIVGSEDSKLTFKRDWDEIEDPFDSNKVKM